MFRLLIVRGLGCASSLALAAGIWLGVSAEPRAQTAPAIGDRFAWLAGCWSGTRGQTAFREIWTVGSPDLMLGMAVTTQPAKPATFDYSRIARAEGAIAYTAQPGGAPPTVFKLADASKPDVNVFVNLQHDYPKRVSYNRVDADTLLAWIDGGEGAGPKIEYPMKRCK